MSKIIKKANPIVMMDDQNFKNILNTYNEYIASYLKKSGFKCKIAGSFEKGLATSKTEDIDINVDVKKLYDSFAKKNEKTLYDIWNMFYRMIDNHFYSEKKNTKSSIEIKIDDFSYSLTLVVDNKKFLIDHEKHIAKLVREGGKKEYNEILFKNCSSKKRRWNTRKMTLIAKFLLSDSLQNLSSWQIENCLANNISNEKNIIDSYEVFKEFLNKLGNDKLLDEFENLRKKNRSAYCSMKNRSLIIYNTIKNYDLKEFVNYLNLHY